MTTSALPVSISVYRGQSRTGIGEGPGKPIAHGEQYLRADPPLDGDASRLRQIQPWMSLDADPVDLDQLGGELEAWSCFGDQGLGYVVRLVSAGVYDRRQAYFSHGRAWPEGAFRGAFDPGAHLGRSQAFEQPWRDQDPGERVAEPDPEMVRPRQVDAEKPAAVRFLAHLLQARVESRPLIIAAPLQDFAAGGALHALVSFARAALPSDLKPGCRIRIYTRNPELFLRHRDADLVAVPEAVAAAALAARHDATLLDRHGQRNAGRVLDPRAKAYAEAVVERACKIPQSLLAFSARFGGDCGGGEGLPGAEEVRSLQITYNLAFAMSGSEQRRGDLLRKYLFKKAGELGPLPWDRLIDAHEWAVFPRQAILESLLRPVDDDGGRALQCQIEEAAGRLGLVVDPLLDDWWADGDAGKNRRVVELLSHAPPLVSATAGLASDEICARLATPALLSLGAEIDGSAGETLRRIYGELDRRTADRERRRETTRALVEGGWWFFWRRQTRLAGEALRSAAFAWLSCEVWSAKDAPQATLETWELALADLGDPPLSGLEMADLCAEHRPKWPWIPPFERRQLDGLARAAGDLGALAELAEAVAPADVGFPPDTAVDRHVLERSGLGDGLPARALLWLSERLPGQRPVLSRGDARRLRDRSGHRQVQAEESLVGGGKAPRGARRPASQVIAALVAGDVERFGSGLAEELGRYRQSGASGPHPVHAIAAEVRAGELSATDQEALRRHGWMTFEQAARGDRCRFLGPPSANDATLPAIDLALATSRPGTVGNAALAVVFAAGSRQYRSQLEWWQALLRGIRDWRRQGRLRSADDRTDVALGLLIRTAVALDPRERDALDDALQREAPSWPLISQFGVKI
ncbi:MAG: hypothetical protein V3T72_20440 [Thermoanaerobaculia bacterium]